jgi:malonyl-CoA/methylmalonyl-CoA synthetase
VPTKAFLTDYLKSHALKNGPGAAIVFEGATLSWAELLDRVEVSSSYILGTVGNKEQQVVSLLLTNSPEFVITYLAIVHAGHIAMPLDPAYKKLELDAIIDQISPVLIITDTRYQGQISSDKAVMVEELLAGKPTSLKPLRLTPETQVASLTFTSGTTGKPKAAPYTHANHLWNIKVCSQVWGWTAKDSLLICLPLSHWYGLVMGLCGVLYHGNTLYLTQQSFDPEAVLKLMSSGKVSMFTHTPFAYVQLLEVRKKYDVSGVRLFISGGGPLAPAIWVAFRKRFGAEIVETYGSSETGRIAGNRLDNRREGSPGQILPEVQLKLSADSEVLIKSPGIFPGYYKNPEATKKELDKDGWWHTGDIAEVKDDFVYLKSRKQERIRKFSYTISPRDVEWALLKCKQIQEVFVMGRQIAGSPNDELVYFIVGDISRSELADFCKTNLLHAWRPDKVIFLDKIPRTTMGKPKITALKEMV